MYIYKTPVTGMFELGGVGHTPAQHIYEDVLKQHDNLKGCKMIAASLTTDQRDGIKFLLKNGFIQIGDAKRNPNSGHMIVLLVKYIRG